MAPRTAAGSKDLAQAGLLLPSELSGVQKAALLLVCLDESTAARMLGDLTPDELRAMRAGAESMKGVRVTSMVSVFTEFEKRAREAMAVPRGGARHLRSLATRVLGEQRARAILDAGVDDQSALGRIARADPRSVASLLAGEHPQVVAGVIAQLPEEQASQILGAFEPELRTEVIRRVTTIGEVSTQVFEEVAAALAADLPQAGDTSTKKLDGTSVAARLLNRLDRQSAEDVLRSLEESQEETAQKVRRAMFTFEDLAKLGKRPLQTLLKEIETGTLVLALKTASDKLKAAVLGSVSSRAGALLLEELELLGPQKLSAVEGAQQEIVDTVLRLESEGRIAATGGSGEKMV